MSAPVRSRRSLVILLVIATLSAGMLGHGPDVAEASTGQYHLYARRYDAAGNRYDSGLFSGTVAFGPGQGTLTGPSTGLSIHYVASYTPAGQFRWARRIGSNFQGQFGGFEVTPGGTAVLSGSAYGTVRINTPYADRALPTFGGYDRFLVAFTGSDGHIHFARTDGGPGAEYARDLALDSVNNIYEVGQFSQTATFGDAPSQATLSDPSWGGGYIASFTPHGALRWAVPTATGNGWGEATEVAVGGGAVYVAGGWTAMATIGSTVVRATPWATNPITLDRFVQRVAQEDGAPQWTRIVKRTTTSGNQWLYDLSYNSNTVVLDGSANAPIGFHIPGYPAGAIFDPAAAGATHYLATYAPWGALLSVAADP